MNPSEIKDYILDWLNTDYKPDLRIINDSIYIIDKVAGLILGIIAYILGFFLPLITVMDILYIIIPPLRVSLNKLNSKWEWKERKYIRPVSKDAVLAVEEANTSKPGKSPLGIYLIKRLKTYIICAIVLGVLLGGMDDIRRIIVNIVVPVIEALRG